MPFPRSLLAIIAVIAIVIISFGLLASVARPAQHHPFFTSEMQLNGPKIIANRGGGGLWPENTLYAFEQATTMGIDILNMDVRRSADGQLVLIHDVSVERTTNGIGPVGRWANVPVSRPGHHSAHDTGGVQQTSGSTYEHRNEDGATHACHNFVRAHSQA